MTDRSIGQERLGFVIVARSASSLEELDGLIDWKPLAVLLGPLYPATKGEPADQDHGSRLQSLRVRPLRLARQTRLGASDSRPRIGTSRPLQRRLFQRHESIPGIWDVRS